MLFDLSFDPMERKNLIHQKDYAAVADDLRARLAKHMADTGDFIESGRLPRPEGMILNTITCIDPDSKDPADYE